MLKGIVKKIFISTTILLLSFFIFQLIFQNTYIEKLYHNSKINNVTKNFSKYITELDKTWETNRNLNYYSLKYKYQNNTPLLILNEDKQILNNNFFNEFSIIEINIGKGEKIYVIADFLIDIDKDILHDFSHGRKISLQGTKIGSTNYIIPMKIIYNDYTYVNQDLYTFFKEENGIDGTLTEYSGYINRFNIISEYTELNYNSNLLLNEIIKLINNDVKLNKASNVTTKKIVGENWSNNEYILFSGSGAIGTSTLFFFTIDKIEKISFIFSSLNPYYILMYAICFIILIIISFFYSKWITTPLLHLNDVAKKIANLDFSMKSSINSNNELGELSDNLNSVSANLEKAINELKHSNEQLANEAAIRAENENRVRYLLTNLSHEFKTPLSIIYGFINILNDRVNDKEPEYYYSVIIDEIDNLNHLIRETIELSKLESRYYNLVFDYFNINDVVKKVCIAFEKKLLEKDLTLIKNTYDVTVYADISKIEQVLINFMSNAVKYTKRGKKIYLRIEKYNDDEIIIYIENESRINDEDISNIWKRYYRSEKNERKSFKGSGIGLEIVKNILELHDSTYGVKNLEDRVQFFFTLSKSGLLPNE